MISQFSPPETTECEPLLSYVGKMRRAVVEMTSEKPPDNNNLIAYGDSLVTAQENNENHLWSLYPSHLNMINDELYDYLYFPSALACAALNYITVHSGLLPIHRGEKALIKGYNSLASALEKDKGLTTLMQRVEIVFILFEGRCFSDSSLTILTTSQLGKLFKEWQTEWHSRISEQSVKEELFPGFSETIAQALTLISLPDKSV